MDDFQFLRPYALFLFLPFLAFFLWYFFAARDLSSWARVCDKDLLPYILEKKKKQQWLPYLLCFVAASLLIAALAGPSWQTVTVPVLKPQSGLVIALDLSNEMDAQDIKPSRLQRAVYKITDLLKVRREGQTALIVFAEDPYVVTPLTDDVAAIKALLPALETRIMPSPGHRTDKAVAKAAELLKSAGISRGAILLITATLYPLELEQSKAVAAKEGLSISVLAIGAEEGAPIPNQEGGFVKDAQGAVVVSMLSKKNLQHLAEDTGGSFALLSIDDTDLTHLSKSMSGNSKEALVEETQEHTRRQDQGYIFVLLTLPLVLSFFRRGLLTIALLLMPHLLQAWTWNDFWKTPDQQGEELYYQKDYQAAQELFQNRDWKGAASYQLGEYEQAAEFFKENQTAEGYYNYGNAKAKQGDFDAALTAYAKTLEMMPAHEDAQYNKKLIEELKQQQQNQSQQQKQEDSKDQKESEQGQNQGSNHDQKQDSDKDQESGKQDSQDTSKGEGSENDQKEEKSNEELREQLQKEMDQKLEEKQNEPMEEKPIREESDQEMDPQRQMDERLLQKVKDDPGGLLRRKFLMQYRQQQQNRRS